MFLEPSLSVECYVQDGEIFCNLKAYPDKTKHVRLLLFCFAPCKNPAAAVLCQLYSLSLLTLNNNKIINSIVLCIIGASFSVKGDETPPKVSDIVKQAADLYQNVNLP